MLKKNQINRGEIIINLTVNGVEYDSGLKVPRDADFRWASQEIQRISNILPLNQYIEVQVCCETLRLRVLDTCNIRRYSKRTVHCGPLRTMEIHPLKTSLIYFRIRQVEQYYLLRE